MSTAERIPSAAPADVERVEEVCPLCARPHRQWAKHRVTLLTIRQAPGGAVAHYGVADTSGDTFLATAQGAELYAAWKEQHPARAAEIEAWACAAVDAANARKHAGK
jgi:hypothetical protein